MCLRGVILDGNRRRGVLDVADYVTWRNALGTTYTQSDYHITFGAPTSTRRPRAKAVHRLFCPRYQNR
jgi:hypothetical protein